MDRQLFRKESMERISSPEQMHDYMRVTSPRLWMILAAILVFLAGFIAYVSTTTMESTISLKVEFSYGYAYADLPISQLDIVKIRMPVRISGREGYISDIHQETRLKLDISFDGGGTLEDGFYSMTFEDREGLPEEFEDSGTYLYVHDGIIVSYTGVPESENALKADRRIRVDGRLGTITDAKMMDAASITISMNDSGNPLADGYYDAEIVTESVTPISFLLN